jgi:formylglycine-generating enzyme required for sulfatase activity
MPVKVFLSYAREDAELLEDLEFHLAPLERDGGIVIWSDRKIPPGGEWQASIEQALEEAEIILLLVSAAFIASDFCYGREMKRALERHESGHAIVIPVILRPVAWERTPFYKLQALPRGARPVEKWGNRAEAFLDVAHGVANAAERVAASRESRDRVPDVGNTGTRPTEEAQRATIGAMKFVLIPRGTFLMGSNDEGENERPVHTEVIPEPFEMGACVVTQGQWRTVMGTEPWRGREFVDTGDEYPAVYVSWHDAKTFIARVNSLDPSFYYRLPSEAEWEYAARAGTATRFSFGDDVRALNAYGWYDENSYNAGARHPHPVGRRRPNEWGLYDMHGNVWEWVEDWYHGSYAAPAGAADEKVVRGGGYDYSANGARSSFRNHVAPNRSNHVIGLRLVRQPVG